MKTRATSDRRHRGDRTRHLLTHVLPVFFLFSYIRGDGFAAR